MWYAVNSDLSHGASSRQPGTPAARAAMAVPLPDVPQMLRAGLIQIIVHQQEHKEPAGMEEKCGGEGDSD
jgi:hypothetical protein